MNVTCSLRATTTLRCIRRRLLSTYYDSQSGMHITRSHSFSLTDISTGISTDLNAKTLNIFKSDRHTPTTNSGVSINIDMPFYNNNITDTVKLIQAAKSQHLQVKANIIDAFSASSSDIQSIAGVIADAEVDIITLCDTSGLLSQDIEDAADVLQDYFEAVTWLDVVGTPLVDRIAIRLNASSNKEVVQMIAEGGDWREMPMIRHWDTCETGEHGLKTELVRSVLLKYGERPDACRGGGSI
jgi:hypothetical protein